MFADTLEAVLATSDPWLVSITDPISIGVLTPPPPSTHGYEDGSDCESFIAHSDSEHKREFFCRAVVTVTAGYGATVSLATDEESQSVLEGCSGTVSNPPRNFDLFELHGYHIDWCHYEVQVYSCMQETL